jgi:hypothetical protein
MTASSKAEAKVMMMTMCIWLQNGLDLISKKMGKSDLTYPYFLWFQFLVTGILEKFELREGASWREPRMLFGDSFGKSMKCLECMLPARLAGEVLILDFAAMGKISES